MSVPSSELAPPAPSSESECVPPGTKGGDNTRLRKKGPGEPIRTKGQTLRYSRYTIIPLRPLVSTVLYGTHFGRLERESLALCLLTCYTVKKRLAHIPLPSRDVTNQTLPWPRIIKLIPARESLVSDIPAGGREIC